MRECLRETALQVSLMAQGGRSQSVEALRERCMSVVTEFELALDALQVPEDVRNELVHAQCALLDEVALSNPSPEDHGEWAAHPLQVERFGNYDAGERVFDKLSERMRQAPPNVEVLQCYAAILGLGFRGRYAREGEAARKALIMSLQSLLAKLQPAVDQSFIIDKTRRYTWFRLSPWAATVAACIVAACVYVACNRVLDVQLAQLLTQSP
ncbi:DotU family type IV/VI secretion system protein [Dyella caseinilytica]|uniref:DotU family type IV/VI secretion system protein n=2 Tax=Dyella caseinilytica TaxID=1849581 RepID=A0ABX7GXI3_9GAMM|nr:DotU family type IV/VI secretion system protein [Dyella caseinilytica]QRN55035.1 DotU family type IV/VI secretion system protein [Dyella caseinilytica]